MEIRKIEADSRAFSWYKPAKESMEALASMEIDPMVIEYYDADENFYGDLYPFPQYVVAGKCTTEDEGRRDVLVALVCEDVGELDGEFFDRETGADLTVEEVKKILAERGEIVSFYMPWRHIPMPWEKKK